MTNLRKTIIPKSDQLNADCFIAGPMTVKITKVSLLAGEQPVSIHFEGDDGKPYKPCKSMRRVMIAIWGDNGNDYIGKSMTLYKDPKVKWGGDEVGGIRISHMSDIKEKVEMALTATRGSRKPFVVLPLMTSSVQGMMDTTITEDLFNEGSEAAERGTVVLKAFWERLKPGQQKTLADNIVGWKKRAVDVDKQVEREEAGDPPSNPLFAG